MSEKRVYLRDSDRVTGVPGPAGGIVRLEQPFTVPVDGLYVVKYDTEHPERTTFHGPVVEKL